MGPGGLNFDCKVRRESVDVEDMFIAHIGAMDTMARGLRNVAKMLEDGTLNQLLNERYLSWSSELGLKVERGQATFEELEAYAKLHGEPKLTSGKQEKFEMIFNSFI